MASESTTPQTAAMELESEMEVPNFSLLGKKAFVTGSSRGIGRAVALALAKLNRRAEAIATYRRAIQLKPDFSEAHFELAGELVADNRLEEAAREYAESNRLNPRDAVSRINLGVVRFRQNRLEEAIQQFEAALQIEPTNAAALDYLRQVTAKRNRKP